VSRAYIRLDPAFDERKESYPDGPFAALVATFCLSEHQPQRGRFRSLDYLARLLGRRGRHLAYLVAHGDVIELPDGRIYVDGWDEWQEGDWKVAERVARIRGREKRTPPVTVPVTVDVTLHPPKAVETDSLDKRSGAEQRLSGGGDSPPPSQPDEWDDPEMPVVQWLAQHGCYIPPGKGYHQHLITGVERHGAPAVIEVMEKMSRAGAKNGDVRGFVFDSIELLDKQSRPTVLELVKDDSQERVKSSMNRRVENTQRMLHESGHHQDAPNPACPICSAA